jgi:hypothetical protein
MTTALAKSTPRPPADEVEETLTPTQKAGRKFSADLKDINSRMDLEIAAMNKLYAANDQAEKLAARQRLLPIILEAQDLFARPGRRDGGMTFGKWIQEWRPKLNVGRTAIYDMLAENNLEKRPLALPKLNEERIVDGEIGRVIEIPPQEDGKMQEVVMEFPVETAEEALEEAVTRRDSVLLDDAKPLKHHTLDTSIIYDKPNGDWCHFANGKLVCFSTEAQRKATAKAAKKAAEEAVKKVADALEAKAAKLEAKKDKPLPKTVSKKQAVKEDKKKIAAAKEKAAKTPKKHRTSKVNKFAVEEMAHVLGGKFFIFAKNEVEFSPRTTRSMTEYDTKEACEAAILARGIKHGLVETSPVLVEVAAM